MAQARTTAALERFPGARVLCVGDVMLDRFIYGRVGRISPEAPIPVLQVTREETMIGGAGNVARNVAALGARAVLIGVCGDDEAGGQLRHLGDGMDGVEMRLIAAEDRPTTIKQRFIAEAQQLLRADRETVRDIGDEVADHVLAAFDAAMTDCDVIVLSDYAKGMLSPAVLPALIARARAAGKPVLCDPKKADFAVYSGASLIKPNLKELQAASPQLVGAKREEEAIAAAARALIARHDFGAMLVTRSAEGMSLVDGDGGIRHFPARAREIYDVSGAGDTVIATLAVALAAGLDYPDAADLANTAGGIVVGKAGTAVVRADELAHALHEEALRGLGRKHVTRDAARDHVSRWQGRGLKVGFTNGCFDLLHPGHLSLLEAARGACDRLIVAINSDASVRRLKGPDRPVQDEAARAMVLAALEIVDLVVVFDEDTPVSLLEFLRPDVLIKGGDYTLDQVVGAREMRQWGGQVVLAPFRDGFSTTATVRRLRNHEVGEE